MTFFYLIDLIFAILILYFSYYAYKQRFYLKFFEYLKIFFILSLSAKLVYATSYLLKSLYIINADTGTISLLISFSLNFFIFYTFFKYFLLFMNQFVNNNLIKSISAKILSFFEISLLITFLLFMFMQVHFIKKFIYPVINKSYSYKYVKKFYITFLSKDFVNIIMTQETKTDSKEIILKSFKNSF